MGIFDRFRKETTDYIQEDAIYGKNSPSNFRSDLLTQQYNNKNDTTHLFEVARQDPIARYIVFKLAENALDDGFTFRDKNGNEIMKKAQKDLIRLNAKQVLTQVLAAERWGGWAWLHVVKNTNYRQETIGSSPIAKLDFFTRKDCEVYEYDVMGQPKELEITTLSGVGAKTTIEQKVRLPASQFILWRTRQYDRSHRGDPITFNIWDDMTSIREIIGSMVFYDAKIGNGLFVIKLARSPDTAMKASMQNEVETFSTQRAVGLDPSIIEDVGFVGAEGSTTDFENHIKILLERIAAGASIPKDVLIGATAGAISGSEVNVKALFQAINSIQQSIEPYIRELMSRLGYNEDYEIDWNVRYAHDEEQRSKIDMNNAQTLAIRSSWLTKNEIRAIEGLPAMEGGDELKKPVDFSVGVSGLSDKEQTPDEREQTRNPNGEQL